MKVIVKQSGFYGGDWFNASEQAIDMKDGVAQQYLPPFGDTLQLSVDETLIAKPVDKAADKASVKNIGKE